MTAQCGISELTAQVCDAAYGDASSVNEIAGLPPGPPAEHFDDGVTLELLAPQPLLLCLLFQRHHCLVCEHPQRGRAHASRLDRSVSGGRGDNTCNPTDHRVGEGREGGWGTGVRRRKGGGGRRRAFESLLRGLHHSLSDSLLGDEGHCRQIQAPGACVLLHGERGGVGLGGGRGRGGGRREGRARRRRWHRLKHCPDAHLGGCRRRLCNTPASRRGRQHPDLPSVVPLRVQHTTASRRPDTRYHALEATLLFDPLERCEEIALMRLSLCTHVRSIHQGVDNPGGRGEVVHRHSPSRTHSSHLLRGQKSTETV
eukprot:Hpha_TRINITY_DN15343_c2_g7::TRINITY_DN15343_c2_g7_i1::g.88324::m.88324